LSRGLGIALVRGVPLCVDLSLLQRELSGIHECHFCSARELHPIDGCEALDLPGSLRRHHFFRRLEVTVRDRLGTTAATHGDEGDDYRCCAAGFATRARHQ
jgi:hypothetical protein